MYIALMATHAVLKKWKQNPGASKAEIGVWWGWCRPSEENNLSLSEAEVAKMKQFFEQHAPTTYRELFPE
jgi:hypothetical protein